MLRAMPEVASWLQKKEKPQTLRRDGVTGQGVILDLCSVLHLF
jgi:hypothetical protein